MTRRLILRQAKDDGRVNTCFIFSGMTPLDQRLQRLARARLYAIVDSGYVEPDRVPFVTEQLVLGGVDLIQLRAEKLPLPAIAKFGQTMRARIPEVARHASARFI